MERSAFGSNLFLKRIYEPAGIEDGKRILVDRLWPRGLSKQRAQLFAWVREVAPSSDLRKWFHADRNRWPEFTRRYEAELADNPGLELIEQALESGCVTLTFATSDLQRNHASVLRDAVLKRLEDTRK